MRPLALCLVFSLASLAGLSAAAADEQPMPSWGLELRVGAYKPVWGTGVIAGTNKTEQDYFDKFFSDGRPLMVTLEIERYIPVPLIGLFGVFMRGGQLKISGKTQLCYDPANPSQVIGCSAADIVNGNSVDGNGATQMTIYPISLGAVYRFDWLERKWSIPLVPYGKAALDYYYWSVSVNGKTASFSGGGAANGGTAGYEAAAGLELGLDWIDPRGSNKNAVFLDSNLFVEYQRVWADGFGNKSKADMSGTQAVFGLAFDFQ